ncbi:Protease PrtS [Methylobacterium frigidaeris]|uniref:Neutral metalloproteinase n=3 Tax=Methylobacterium frigidaeris TaxID=2038277 RepID=A0AA37H9Y6_9HYPH|nr:Protease PrtS [Methylobacterium frigidaeris]
MCTCRHRHSIFCVLPPYILKSIQKNGSKEQVEAAINTLSVDSTFRSVRLNLTAAVSPAQRERRVLGPAQSKQRTIYTADNVETLPGKAVRTEGAGPSGDVAVDEAYDGLGHTFDFFSEIFDRNSIDDEGMPLNATVHYGPRYSNAFWNGQRMVFGDGDGELFNRFTIALDVIGHELGHGVTEDETGLVYLFQSGALNEHLSDVWGSLIKQWYLRQTSDQADWLIGAGLLADGVKGQALRSMKKPGSAFDDPVLGRDPQPGHMDDYEETYADNGGVHINSGIPNRAFYLAATSVGGYAWEKIGRVWYETIRSKRVKQDTKFKEFANLTVATALRTPGCGPIEQKAIAEAWAEVGVLEKVAPKTTRAVTTRSSRQPARMFEAQRGGRDGDASSSTSNGSGR